MTAARGLTLAAAERWTFNTPPPTLVDSYPRSGPTGLTPVIYVELDQAVDAAEVIRLVQVTGNAKPVEVRAATEEEIRADRNVRVVSEKAQAGRWVALEAKAPLAPGTVYTVRLPPGLPSAEGPRRTEKEQVFAFAAEGDVAFGLDGNIHGFRGVVLLLHHENEILQILKHWGAIGARRRRDGF